MFVNLKNSAYGGSGTIRFMQIYVVTRPCRWLVIVMVFISRSCINRFFRISEFGEKGRGQRAKKWIQGFTTMWQKNKILAFPCTRMWQKNKILAFPCTRMWQKNKILAFPCAGIWLKNKISALRGQCFFRFFYYYSNAVSLFSVHSNNYIISTLSKLY